MTENPPRQLWETAIPVAVPRAALPQDLPPPGAIVLGMPHLTDGGLSEIWLLQDLGHRHWMMLAEAAGLAMPDFRLADGEPVYAAFCAVAVEEAHFDLAAENDALDVTSSLHRISRSMVGSLHEVSIGGSCIGRVAMISTFIHRPRGHGNRHVARVAIEIPPAGGPVPEALARLAETISAQRSRRQTVVPQAAAEARSTTFDPVPGLDFNGAGLLYFTAFVAAVERAEWALDRDPRRRPLASRTIIYAGNVDPGERLTIHIGEPDTGLGDRRVRIWRSGDGVEIAAMTIRRRSGSSR